MSYIKVIDNITIKYNTLPEKSKEYLVNPNEILCLYKKQDIKFNIIMVNI